MLNYETNLSQFLGTKPTIFQLVITVRSGRFGETLEIVWWKHFIELFLHLKLHLKLLLLGIQLSFYDFPLLPFAALVSL